MAHVPLEYGPPAQRGVTTLMSVGDEVVAPSGVTTPDKLRMASLVSAGLAVVAFASGKKKLGKNLGWASLGLELASYFSGWR